MSHDVVTGSISSTAFFKGRWNMTRFESSIQARIPTRIVKELEQVAEAKCQTMSALVRDFVVRGLKRIRKSDERRQGKE